MDKPWQMIMNDCILSNGLSSIKQGEQSKKEGTNV
jgi:hypothetical protein